MNIHEHQAKELLKSYGAPVAAGVAIFSADEAEAAAKSLPGPLYVVKSQIHAGGRGKGKFKELGPDAKGGVRLAKSIDEVVAFSREMLGNTLVTKQTGPAGKQVNRLYIEDGADIARELYCSLLVDRATGRVSFVISTEGGMDIEAVAEATPEKIITADPAVKGILVNIFGGIMRCDVIAEGVIAAVKEVGLQVPLVVRLEGTNVKEGKAILNASGLDVISADDLDDAAQKIVAAIRGRK